MVATFQWGREGLPKANKFKLVGVVANPDGSSLFRGEASGCVAQAEELGRELAERLLSQGAQQILIAS